ncbi:hypothetical protein JCM11602_05690 [Thermus brockianus]
MLEDAQKPGLEAPKPLQAPFRLLAERPLQPPDSALDLKDHELRLFHNKLFDRKPSHLDLEAGQG